MAFHYIFAALLTFAASAAEPAAATGAWEQIHEDGTVSTLIVSDKHFSVAHYDRDPATFLSTRGGSWSVGEDGALRLNWEFSTDQPEIIGTTHSPSFRLDDDTMFVDDHTWKRIDHGAPGALDGAWLMTGRKRDGEIRTRMPGARRTMKILSGTRFQWIAYNVETKEFFGTGGGTYTTEDCKYTENIEFFSRDNATVGKSLEFRYDLVDGVWHHDGKSSKGDPMYEVWSPRSKVGI